MECPHCKITHDESVFSENLMVCPECGHHLRISPQERLKYLADENTIEELFTELATANPIQMDGYEEKLDAAKAKTNLDEAIITVSCKMNDRSILLGLMSFDFMGGSMGSVVGEKITRLMIKGAEEKTPVLIYATSGGARMQEGLYSLMQMAKTSSAAACLDEAGVPYFVMLCDPTTGGVTASFAMLGDIICAEPKALIGFAGPRVIEGTINQKLPDGFQRAEFQQQKGFVDCIVPRSEQKQFWTKMIDLHRVQNKVLLNGEEK